MHEPIQYVPRELRKVSLPTYVIEPPDVLTIDAISLIPKSPYRLRTFDVISFSVEGALDPIAGNFPVLLGGAIDLGDPLGMVPVSGLTPEEARVRITERLAKETNNPVVSPIRLVQIAGQQQIQGQHVVAPDGSVNLGIYGSVRVVGMTLGQAKQHIEQHLSAYLDRPEVAVDVFAYNSKVYYIVTEGAGLGDQIVSVPFVGNETVLDALAQINGLSQVSSKRIWIARPTPNCNEAQILPVDFRAVTARASATTNYQILPGDRIFVAEDRLIAWDTSLGKFLAPIERVMGFTLLGTGTVSRLSGNVLRVNQNNFGGGFGGGFGP